METRNEPLKERKKRRLFFDMDGVLVDLIGKKVKIAIRLI